MSTFSGLTAASTALSAARRGIDLVGQNIANQATPGYTRQRLETSAIAAVAVSGRFSTGAIPGQGVLVDGIARLGDGVLDARVRDALGASGYWSKRAEAAVAAETRLAEPTVNGLADRLSQFWAGWQDLSNTPDSAAAAAVVINGAEVLVAQLAGGYRDIVGQWSSARDSAARTVDEVNIAAAEVAGLNAAIRDALNAGSPANELVDRRNLVAERIARLTGAEATGEADGTLTVRLDGNPLVAGTNARRLSLEAPASIESGAPVTVAWEPGGTSALVGGELGGLLSVLAPAGEGGMLADLAASYNSLATALATAVNAQHRAGQTRDGSPGGDFFSIAAGVPAALSLGVVPTSGSGLALAGPGGGALDASNADALAGIGERADSPDALWAGIVSRFAVATAGAIREASRADAGAAAATAAQLSVSGVDNDEETLTLLTYQTAYQAAARVLTAVDEALDVLINRTGLVGR